MLWLATMTGHTQSYTLDLGAMTTDTITLVTLVKLVDNSTIGNQTALKVASSPSSDSSVPSATGKVVLTVSEVPVLVLIGAPPQPMSGTFLAVYFY